MTNYAEGFHRGHGTCRSHEMELLAGHERVLEVAPSRAMTEWMREQGHDVTVLDRALPSASRFAATRVLPMDLDRDRLPESLIGAFDAVLLGNVLEHLRDPVAVLQAMGRCLAPDGVVVVSVPNGAHADVRLALAAGRWPWRDNGILDRTHLRFYTADTLGADVAAAGFEVGAERATHVHVGATNIGPDAPPTEHVSALLDADPTSRVHVMTWELRPVDPTRR